MVLRTFLIALTLVACNARPRLSLPGTACKTHHDCSTALCRQGICQDGISNLLIADARPRSQTVAVGQVVQIIGAFSDTGETLTYQWSLQGPATSEATLDSATAQNISFVADVAGPYLIRLVVSDGFTESRAALVAVLAVEQEDSSTHRIAALIPDQQVNDESIYLTHARYERRFIESVSESTPPQITSRIGDLSLKNRVFKWTFSNDPKRGYLLHELVFESISAPFDPPLVYWPLVLREGVTFTTFAKTIVLLEGNPSDGQVTHQLTHHGVGSCRLDDKTTFDECHKIERLIRYSLGSVLVRREHWMHWVVAKHGVVKFANLENDASTRRSLLSYQKLNGKVVFGTRPALKIAVPYQESGTFSMTDNSRTDWDSIPSVWTDQKGDNNTPLANTTGVDLKQLSFAFDDTSIFVLMTFHDGPPSEQVKYEVSVSPRVKVTGVALDIIITKNGTKWSGVHRCGTGSLACTGEIQVQAGADFLEVKIQRDPAVSVEATTFAFNARTSFSTPTGGNGTDGLFPSIELSFEK